MTNIVWFRDDLRLSDHPALTAAAEDALLCVYVHDETAAGVRALGGAARWRLDRGLRALAAELARRGGALHVLRGAADELLPRLVEAAGAKKIAWSRRYGGAEIAQDTRLKSRFRDEGREALSFNGALLAEPWEVRTGSGGPFKVFTPFWRALREKIALAPPLPAPAKLHFAEWPIAAPERVSIDALALAPRNPDWAAGFPDPEAGELGAQARLSRFLDSGLGGYASGRDRLDLDATSRLSAHLRFGEISPRQIFGAASARGGADKFLSEIGWREFSYCLLFENPDLAWRNFNARFDAFPFQRDEAAMTAWKRGRTGYPLVDAAMRELWRTGSMHNRARMVCASFLTKHLLIDWREGESWFWETLCDADAASNAASWQWTAGCGADAAPYFRIFNPVLQGEKFDPDGAYVRRYCPELSRQPARYIHRPWTAPAAVLAEAGVKIGRDWPAPIVEHDFARRRALAAFAEVSGAAAS